VIPGPLPNIFVGQACGKSDLQGNTGHGPAGASARATYLMPIPGPAGATALLPALRDALADSRIIPISNHFDSGPIREKPQSCCRNNVAPYRWLERGEFSTASRSRPETSSGGTVRASATCEMVDRNRRLADCCQQVPTQHGLADSEHQGRVAMPQGHALTQH